ncbi:hypothetical protein Syun_029575 [Stephania yunnanensis]|uniref:Uncharacterized protein n=1 Tax=Stephania yunnanensis TaxID=152371 RepID=A0AAP0HJZ6_9MAGN
MGSAKPGVVLLSILGFFRICLVTCTHRPSSDSRCLVCESGGGCSAGPCEAGVI